MELDRIAVTSQQRRTGIARALFEEAVAEARRAGISGVELNVLKLNRDAREAFENLGFRARAIRMERRIFVGLSLHRQASRSGHVVVFVVPELAQ